MSLNKKTVARIAELSALEMSDADLEKMAPQLSHIMEWIEQLSEVDTDNVEPLANVAAIELTLREDKITDGNCTDKVLANAPEQVQNFFVVPKIVEQEE